MPGIPPPPPSNEGIGVVCSAKSPDGGAAGGVGETVPECEAGGRVPPPERGFAVVTSRTTVVVF
jgi:hypothetical protein